jgi:asparagine synthase (glutamine-hydrolysing)
MCGIAGILRTDGSSVETTELLSMLAPMAHRGPDGSGSHVDGAIGLGHWRLSILDPTPAGAQPMKRNGCWLIHNGEIYNFLELATELRAAGHELVSASDTEVILAAYEEWGLDAFRRFNGMWAMAIWDAPRSRLVLSRDRFGVKPLLIRRSPGQLTFASELPGLLAAPGPTGGTPGHEPNLTAVRDFLVRGLTDHSTETFIDGVTTLPPGHSLVVEPGGERLVRYWSLPALADDDRPAVHGEDARRDDELVEEFRALFDDSVRLRLRSDVPIGSCLSGGLDSSAIVATFSHLLQEGPDGQMRDASGREAVPRFAFHARFPGLVDESRFADLAANRAGLTTVYSSPVLEAVADTLAPVLRAQGEPFASSSIYAQYRVMESAQRTGLKVLLDGQGGDEICGGYTYYLGVQVAGLARTGHLTAAAGSLREQVRRGTFGAAGAILGAGRGLLDDGVNEQIRRYSRGRWGVQVGPALRGVGTLRREHGMPGTLLARRLWQDATSDGLPALLRYEDRNSMAFGIETRVPFLDYRLAEHTMRLPDRLRVNRGETKVVLRRAMRGRVPHQILDRRDKVGFATPQRHWLSQGREQLAARMVGGQVVERGWVEGSEIERLLDVDARRQAPDAQLWRVYILEEWLRALWPDGRS